MMRPSLVVTTAFAAASERMLDLHPIPEDGLCQQKSPLPTRPSTACAATTAAYPVYPGLQMPKLHRTRSVDSPPIALRRPRRLSGTKFEPPRPLGRPSRTSRAPMSLQMTTTVTAFPSSDKGLHGHDQIDARVARPTGSMPMRTPPLLKKQKSGRLPLGELCGALPGEVLEVILEMLKQLHLDRPGESCATCWMRDACSVALCSRKWYKAARLVLYQDIQLIGPDSAAHKKRFRKAQGCRMALLRRTLRADAEIASIVRSLKVPAPEPMASALIEQYENQVASVVMACPNLERLSGPVCVYNHSFKRLFQALSTRTNLKTMDWVLDAAAAAAVPPVQQQQQATASPVTKHNASQDQDQDQDQKRLLPHDELAFLQQHVAWTKLTSLSVQCLLGVALAPPTLLARTMAHLPSLRHLHLHDLAPGAFNDANLVDLPPLRSLTLSHVRGISSSGLSAFATRANSQPLRRLVLRHTPLTSLPALARILSNLRSLTSLSLVQSFPPLMPDSDSFVLWMMPYLASSSVDKLHWDITSHPDGVNAADDILAQSIAAGGFPALRVLRAPNDPEGVFQQLCRPVARIDLPADRFRRRGMSLSELETTSPPSPPPPPPTKSLVKSSTTSSLPGLTTPRPHTSLVAARLAAQERLDRARENPRFQVRVTDERGGLVEAFGLAGYMGTVGSKIDYHLLPDAGATDEQGGLVDVSALRTSPGEIPGPGSQGCTGSWNRREGIVADRKEKDRWWHTERGRWTRVYL
ncbi:hypothetical protein E4U42_002927 [Claviceps africana]|uniref:F-box domain-containing protein n=1 Tax=Claviceps africana TaxID=83212 RepID=A0A8K0J858_9HYPO|nr:hypothetical protein E4U42_002927 [Claviceps africana]